ncbi:MAG: Uma2 family endonuclease [Anaerolineae bacterium]
MAIQQRLYTVEEFEQIADLPENRDRLLQLINGEIVEKVPTLKHGQIVMNVGTPFNLYAMQHKAGRVAAEVRHRLAQGERSVFIPDVAYFAGKKPMVDKGSVPYVPDLAVEIKSPDDSYKEMRAKARIYLQHGTRIVWLVFPEKRIVEVHTVDDERPFTEDEVLDGGDVMPGFTMPVRAVFADPVED